MERPGFGFLTNLECGGAPNIDQGAPKKGKNGPKMTKNYPLGCFWAKIRVPLHSPLIQKPQPGRPINRSNFVP